MSWTAMLSLILRSLGYLWCANGSLVLLKVFWFLVPVYNDMGFYGPILGPYILVALLALIALTMRYLVSRPNKAERERAARERAEREKK